MVIVQLQKECNVDLNFMSSKALEQMMNPLQRCLSLALSPSSLQQQQQQQRLSLKNLKCIGDSLREERMCLADAAALPPRRRQTSKRGR